MSKELAVVLRWNLNAGHNCSEAGLDVEAIGNVISHRVRLGFPDRIGDVVW